MTTSRIRGTVTWLVALLVMVTTVIPLATDRAQAAPEDQPAAAAAVADWVADELDDPEPSFDEFGATAARTDVLFALAATGAREGSSRQALADLADGAADYIGAPGTVNTGALAKVLLAILINREDPSGFVPGRDLEAELRASLRADGSFADDVFSHSLAMVALAATPAGVPTPAMAWLVGEQSPDGSWPNPFAPEEADLDTTALALQALLAAGESSAAGDAAAFLVGEQNSDGSWPSPFGDPNANTAGVAGQALRAAGETTAADQAAEFVMSLQTEDGGIKFVASDDGPNGFATLQGVLALGGPAYHELETDPYADVDWSNTFAREADWLGDRDVSRGCDPPANDNYCPDQPVTRAQMAAFMHRALGDTLTADEPADFDDTADSIFAEDIAWLAATGVTRGCDPPANDNYCPDQPVTRAQMAAFLFRALAG